MENFIIGFSADEKFSNPTIKITITPEGADKKRNAELFSKLNILLCQKTFLSEDNEESEHKFFYDPEPNILKFYVQKLDDLKEILEKFPQRSFFRPKLANDSSRGAAGPIAFNNRNEVMSQAATIMETAIENHKNRILPPTNEDGNLALNIKFNSLSPLSNKAFLSYDIFPFRICITKTPETKEFFTRDVRINSIKSYLEHEFRSVREKVKNGLEIDGMAGRMFGDNIEIAATSFEHIEKFLNADTFTKKKIFRNVTFFHEGKEITINQFRAIAFEKRNELIEQFEGKPNGSLKHFDNKEKLTGTGKEIIP